MAKIDQSSANFGPWGWWFPSLDTRGPILMGAWVQPGITNDHHVWNLYNGNLRRSPQHTLQIELMPYICTMNLNYGHNKLTLSSNSYSENYNRIFRILQVLTHIHWCWPPAFGILRLLVDYFMSLYQYIQACLTCTATMNHIHCATEATLVYMGERFIHVHGNSENKTQRIK